MAMGWPDEERDLYQEYYDACNSYDDFREVRKAEIQEEIKKEKEKTSYQGGL